MTKKIMFTNVLLVLIGVLMIAGCATNNAAPPSTKSFKDVSFGNCLVTSAIKQPSSTKFKIECKSSAISKGVIGNGKVSLSCEINSNEKPFMIQSVNVEAKLSADDIRPDYNSFLLDSYYPDTLWGETQKLLRDADRLLGKRNGIINVAYQIDDSNTQNDIWKVSYQPGYTSGPETDNSVHYAAFLEGLQKASRIKYQVGSKKYVVNLVDANSAVEEYTNRCRVLGAIKERIIKSKIKPY